MPRFRCIFRTITCSVCLLAALVVASGAEPARLDVSYSGRRDTAGRISSLKDGPGGEKVLHGLQVVLGPNNWMKEYLVYNEGSLEQRYQFYPSGEVFRSQFRKHDGDGHETISPALPNRVIAERLKVDGGEIKVEVHEPICSGRVQAGQRWEGTFLEREYENFSFKLVLNEYHAGKLVKSEPFPIAKLGLPSGHTNVDSWLWDFPDWPAETSRSAR